MRRATLGAAAGGALAAALAVTLAAHQLAPEAAAPPPLEVLVLRDVVPAGGDGLEVVVLQASGSTRLVPIFVAPAEGEAIRQARAGEVRPLRLLERSLHAIGGEIDAAVLDVGDGAGLEARLVVDRGGERVSVPAAPADAIVVALVAGRQILVTEQALEEAALTREDLRELSASSAAASDDPEREGPVLSL